MANRNYIILEDKDGKEVLPVTDGNGVFVEGGTKKLESKLTEIDSKTTELSGQLDNIETEKATKLEVDVERKRIDLLTKIENGETEGNTELLDIRVGADGIIYDTAGIAIREQFTENTNQIADTLEYVGVTGNSAINKKIIELIMMGTYDSDEKYRIRQCMIYNNQYRFEIEDSSGNIVASTSLNAISDNYVLISEANSSGIYAYAYINKNEITTDNIYSWKNKIITSKGYDVNRNPILKEYLNSHSINAYDYGFRPTNTADDNVLAMQKLLNKGGTIVIDVPGEYRVNAKMLISNNTTLIFRDGVVISVEQKDGLNPHYIFVNEGAYKQRTNVNIKIVGYNVKTNGIKTANPLDGLRGYLALWHVKNVHIDGMKCDYFPEGNFGFGLCDFNNVLIENCRLIGDGVCFQTSKGNRLTIRSCEFCAVDDAIALNAWDWYGSNPQIGDITNVLIENCIELSLSENTQTTHDYTIGYFVRMLNGCWKNWESGMNVKRGTTVLSNGCLYRASSTTDLDTISTTRPECDFGSAVVVDGIRWVNFGSSSSLGASCKNITIRNCTSYQKKGYGVFCIDAQNSDFGKSYVDGATWIPNENIIIDRCTINGITPQVIYLQGDLFNLVMKNCYVDCNNITNAIFGIRELFEVDNYHTPYVILSENFIYGASVKLSKNIDCTRQLNIRMSENYSYCEIFKKDINTNIVTTSSACNNPSNYSNI
ncbi:hypothetical protein [Paraclostridium bifermentans]|uniref:hypothetical protein n=1 Tax=Paraclostridium bifermentans TaxID=1490 RepID=UPI0018A0AF5D|nr:hypothetical protein [Paraclostridium bifermentans]